MVKNDFGKNTKTAKMNITPYTDTPITIRKNIQAPTESE